MLSHNNRIIMMKKNNIFVYNTIFRDSPANTDADDWEDEFSSDESEPMPMQVSDRETVNNRKLPVTGFRSRRWRPRRHCRNTPSCFYGIIEYLMMLRGQDPSKFHNCNPPWCYRADRCRCERSCCRI